MGGETATVVKLDGGVHSQELNEASVSCTLGFNVSHSILYTSMQHLYLGIIVSNYSTTVTQSLH